MKNSLGQILVVLVLLATEGAVSQAAEQEVKKLRRAPDFTLLDWQGEKVALRDYRGRVILLQFFQTGCPTCQHEAPLLEDIYQRYKDRGVVLIGISHDAGGAAEVKKFAERFGISFPLVLGDLEVAVRYVGITPQRTSFDIPHFFLINREGYIVGEFAPGRTPKFFLDEKQALEQALDRLLAAPTSNSGAEGGPRWRHCHSGCPLPRLQHFAWRIKL